MPILNPARFFFRPPGGLAPVALFLAGWIAVGGARADVKTKPGERSDKKDPPEQLIPEVRDMSATFIAGQAVNIELPASTSSLRPVEFLIRQQPANGTLSAVRSHPRETNKGIVTYTHRGGDAPLADRFTFACRVGGGPVSAPATVTLSGRRFEPKLELVDYMPVDKVFLGSEATVRFAVKNSGAADFAGDVTWEDPWHGPARIELKPGETGRYIVMFRPERPGIYRLEKLLQPGVADSKLPLYGQCIRALTVSPGRLELVLGSSGAREGELQLVNGRLEPVRVQVRPSGRLQGGGAVDVPGGGKARISLALPPQDVAAYQGEVQVTSTQGGETVTVVAAAKPAELKVVAPQGASLDLGKVPVGKEARGEVTIRNIGGSASIIQARAHTPLTVRPSGGAVRLEPGEQAVFTLSMIGDQPGPLAGELTFSGDSTAPRIPVQLQVLAADAPVASRASTSQDTQGAAPEAPGPPVVAQVKPAERTPMQHILMSYLASVGLPVPKERINPFLEPVTSLDVLDRTSHSLTIAWKKPSVMPASWIIEGATIAQAGEGGGGFVKIWIPLKNWKIVDGGANRVAAHIEPLPSAAQIELRIMGADRDQKVAEPSPGFIITTADTWHFPRWFWQALAIGALVAVIYVLNKMRLGQWRWRIRREPRPAADSAQHDRGHDLFENGRVSGIQGAGKGVYEKP